jgi:SAM-dependent methyltransferase
VTPLPSDEVIRATYLAPDYHAAAVDEAERMRADADARVAQLARMNVTSVLEVGCGTGYFLDAAADVGMRVEGVDPAASAQRAVARGHTVHTTWLDALELEDQFDAIAMFEVLEHLADPLAALRRARAFIRPGGLLAISTPSSSGVPARLLGRRFPLITPPEHLCLFTRKGLWALLRRGGFEVATWRSLSGLGCPQLARGFQRFALGSSSAARIGAYALAAIAWPATKVVDRAGLGTTFEVYARAV